jgi:hypothetical protein
VSPMDDWRDRTEPLGFREPQLAYTEGVLERPFTQELARIRAWVAGDAALICLVAAAALSIHLLTAARYGYFRDELYYAACGQHLAWGYVDQAPLIAAICWFTRRLFGDSLLSLRFFPALSAAAKVLLTAWFVRELHGKRFAYALAAIAVCLCPIYLTMDSFLSMNSFEPLFWMGCAATVMRIAKGGSPRLWLLFGAIAGVGILNKHSMLFFGLAIVLGLAVASGTGFLRNVWVWWGALICFLIFLPNLVWEIQHHFPTIEILRNAASTKNAPVPWYDFLAEQALLVHPLGTPICLAGLWFFFATRQGRAYRFLGWAYVFLLLQMLILKGRIYYVAPVYPMLFAAGAVWIETQIQARGWELAKRAILIPLAAGGIVAAPLALPILPVGAAAAYSEFWDTDKVRVENYDSGRLPQFFADMFGWPEQVAVVASVYNGLTPGDRERCAILAANYGEAGAIDYFGTAHRLPRAISPHNNYYLWGPRGYSGDVVIAVGMGLQDLQPLFGEIRQAGMISNPYAIPGESNLPVYVCRRPRMPLLQAWPRLKFFG